MKIIFLDTIYYLHQTIICSDTTWNVQMSMSTIESKNKNKHIEHILLARDYSILERDGGWVRHCTGGVRHDIGLDQGCAGVVPLDPGVRMQRRVNTSTDMEASKR